MTEIFGWHGTPLEPAAVTRLHAAFHGEHLQGTSTPPEAADHVLWCRAGHAAGEGGRQGVIIGAPRWSDPQLAALARERGAAHALLQAYEQYDIRLFEHLGGPFSLALLDQARDRLLLAVDRMGVHAMYHASVAHGEGIVFGSSLNGLCRHPQVESRLDPQALFDYLYFHMVPSPLTIYRNIGKLPPAHYLEVCRGEIRQNTYWNPEFTEEKAEPFNSLAEQLRAHLDEAMSHLPAGVGTGAFLSGGVDSSTVVGLMSRRQEGPVEAFSIGFDARGYDEIGFARKTASFYGARLHEYYVTPEDIMALVPEMVQAYDEPFGNSSVIPTYYCARLAREHGIHTMLAGDGGDELFAGNARYAKQKVFEFYERIPLPLRRLVLEPLAGNFPARDHIMPLRKLHSYIEQASIPLPQRLESYNFMERVDLHQVLDEGFMEQVDIRQPHALMKETYDRARARHCVNRMLYHDWKFTLADNDLRKVNHMCGLAGVEVRYPLLDDMLVEFSTRVPPELKLAGLKLRHFFKQALKDFLPPHTLSKSKHGFGLPFGEWLKTSKALQSFTYDALHSMKRRHILREDFIDDLISSHRSGHAAFYGDMIWITMVLEHWLASRGL